VADDSFICGVNILTLVQPEQIYIDCNVYDLREITQVRKRRAREFTHYFYEINSAHYSTVGFQRILVAKMGLLIKGAIKIRRIMIP